MPQSTPEMFAIHSPIHIEVLRVPAGEFLMGSDTARDSHGDRGKEQPQHLVYLAEYYIGRYPVTNLQYAAFVSSTRHQKPASWKGGKPPSGKEDHPVVGISWNDAVAFCEWLSQASGEHFRLPTEAEWEKAARGTDGRIFPWGDDWDPTRVSVEGGGQGDTSPVGSFSPGSDSPYHAADMVGNTFEYCSSVYKKYPYRADDGREDMNSTARRVLRGGPTLIDGWWDVLRCAVRHSTSIDKPGRRCGFRVALSSKRGGIRR